MTINPLQVHSKAKLNNNGQNTEIISNKKRY